MMTATARKTSLDNKHLRSCDHFVVIPSCSHSTMLVNYAATGLVCAPLNSKQRLTDLWLYGQAVIKTAIVVISCPFPEDVRNFFKVHAAPNTCIMIIFPDSTNWSNSLCVNVLLPLHCQCQSSLSTPQQTGTFSPLENLVHLWILWCLLVSQVLLFTEFVALKVLNFVFFSPELDKKK